MRLTRRWVMWGMIAVATAYGCGPGDERDPATAQVVPEFPAEVTAADFSGTSYARWTADIPAPASLHGPVWLIGIDGATWDLILPLAAAGDLPNFKALLETGAHGILLSEEPTISPALWATIATGMPRFEHGIVDFLVKLPGSQRSVESGPRDRHSPAVWELVDSAGGSSAVLSWFGSFPAEHINGYYISKGFDPENLHQHQVHPDAFRTTLSEQADVQLHQIDTEQIAKSKTLRRSLLNDARTMAALRVITASSQPDLVAVYFAGIDAAQHVTWRHMDPTSQQFPQDGPAQPELADVIPAYYRFIDRLLGDIRSLAPENTTLMIVSDHGAGPQQPAEAFHLQLNVLLEQLGLMGDGENQTAFAIDELYRHDKRIWLDHARDDALRRAQALETQMRALRTDLDEPLFASIVSHVNETGWHPDDPVLTVRFSSAALLATSAGDGNRTIDFSKVRLRHSDVSGAHRLEGVLLLDGPGIVPGPLPTATHYQIAPTLLYLLGLPQDRRMLRYSPGDGAVIEAAIRPADLQRFPIAMLAEYPETDRFSLLRSRTPTAEPEEADPAFEESLEKLKSLGYVR
jgi:predicted AlkP superfamily phosphohydrolase/phosphomutase